MSDIIHLLPDAVANQIAAGEVIQRPSSVVKELVENSIDAGADKIQVKVVDAGKTEIQIVDNGKGMSETDARLAFERHATSKISTSNDLYALTTMGFRGEALASVAAVAQITLKTKEKDKEIGTLLRLEGSKILYQESVACQNGTNFSIQNLFYNIPARRKFLKSNTTELSNISTEFERIALANPSVGFELYNGENRLLTLNAENFKRRIVNIFGKKLELQLIPIETKTELVNISGFISSPEGAKRKNPRQFFFVNNRYMRNPYFNKAIQTAYERLIPENEQAQFFINLEVDTSRIDVNVHPTKTEIKFQDETAIWQIIQAAVRESLGRYNAVPTIDFDSSSATQEIPVYDPRERVSQPSISNDKSYNPFNNSYQSKKTESKQEWKELYDDLLQGATVSQDQTANTPTLYDHLTTQDAQEWTIEDNKCIQYKGKYILSYSKDGIILVDQHRAHIRILYDKFIKQSLLKDGKSQGLLFPELIQLPPSQAEFLKKIIDDLNDVGFDLSDMGNGSFSINGMPVGTEGVTPNDLIEKILENTIDRQTTNHEDLDHLIASSLARESALPYGQFLDEKEMSTLINDLFTSDNPQRTPDGKKIIITIKDDQLNKMF